MESRAVTAFDNTKLMRYTWALAEEPKANEPKANEPKAVIQLAHGMMEHAARYDDFANFLNLHGYIVVAQDFRAFGRSATLEENGVYGGDWYGDCVRDEIELHRAIKKSYPDLPVVFFGHSAGSYVGQYLIQQKGVDFAAAILCGTSCMKSGLYKPVQAFVSMLTAIRGYERPAGWIDRLIFGTYNKPYREEGKNAWLSRDAGQVEAYNQDPYCGRTCSYGFYRSFLGFSRLYEASGLEAIPKSLPIFLIAGENDQLNGGKGQGVLKMAELYKSLGIEDVKVTLYPGARHEILNEVMNFEVYEDILHYLSETLRA